VQEVASGAVKGDWLAGWLVGWLGPESMKPSCGKTLNYFRRAAMLAQKCKVLGHAPSDAPASS